MKGIASKSIFLLVIWCLLIGCILGQMSFVLNNYTVSPNSAKSVSSLYTFAFSAYNPSVGTMNLVAIYPSNFILTAVTGCEVKL